MFILLEGGSYSVVDDGGTVSNGFTLGGEVFTVFDCTLVDGSIVILFGCTLRSWVMVDAIIS